MYSTHKKGFPAFPVLFVCLGAAWFSTGCAGLPKWLGLASEEQGPCPGHFATFYNRGRGPETGLAPESEAIRDAKRREILRQIRFAHEEFDIGGFRVRQQPDRLRIPRDGKYLIRLRTNFQQAAREPTPEEEGVKPSRVVAFTVDDEIIHRETFYNRPHSSGYWPTLENSVELQLRAGQYVGARSGGSTSRITGQPVDIMIRRVCSS